MSSARITTESMGHTYNIDEYIMKRLYLINRNFTRHELFNAKSRKIKTFKTVLPNIVRRTNKCTGHVNYTYTLVTDGVTKRCYTTNLTQAIEEKLNNFTVPWRKQNFIEKLKIYLKENQ